MFAPEGIHPTIGQHFLQIIPTPEGKKQRQGRCVVCLKDRGKQIKKLFHKAGTFFQYYILQWDINSFFSFFVIFLLSRGRLGGNHMVAQGGVMITYIYVVGLSCKNRGRPLTI